MSLVQLVYPNLTDKNTVHSYLPLYQELLIRKKETARHVLEVGIFMGGSIQLWHDFFSKRYRLWIGCTTHPPNMTRNSR
jgi:hypothetical protein